MDGYVDIAKDPWIDTLGATVELFLLGFIYLELVPLRDIAYFVNQPAIQEYLQRIQNQGGIKNSKNRYTR